VVVGTNPSTTRSLVAKQKTARPYVAHLTSNLKSSGGKPWTVELGPKTLVVGPNRSGKSRITQSLELALAGAADDLFGRNDVKAGDMLMGLVSGERLSVAAKLSDDALYAFTVTEGARPKHDAPVLGQLPLREIREVLSGSPATARRSFMRWAVQDVRKDDVFALVPAQFHAKLGDIFDANRGKSAPEALLGALEYVGKRQRDAAKEVAGAEALIQSMALNLEEHPAEEDLAEATQMLTYARDLLAKTREDVDAASTIDTRTAAVEATLTQGTGPVEEGNLDFAKATRTSLGIALVEAPTLDSCTMCSSPVGNAHLKACLGFYEGEVARLSKGRSQLSESDRWRLQDELTKLRALKLRLSRFSPQQAHDSAQAAFDLATERNDRLLQAKATWDSMKRARETVSMMAGDVEVYKNMKKALEGAVATLLKSAAGAFAAKVQAFLPKDWKFEIQLTDGDREVFRLGLRQGGHLNLALSGVEWASVTMAIAMVVATAAPIGVPILTIPEDRGWDGTTLSQVMRAWSDFDGQVIIATTTRPVRPPKDWKVIELGAAHEEEEDPVLVDVLGPRDGSPAPEPAIAEFKPSQMMYAMLKALGFDDHQVGNFTEESAAAVVSKGMTAAQVDILPGGIIRPIGEGSNVLTMPTRSR
jgi:hypothetical protein